QIIIATDKAGLAQNQIAKYEELKDTYKKMVVEEKKNSGLIGNDTAVVSRRAGGSKFTIVGATVVDYDVDKNTVNLRHKDDKGVITTKTYNADYVRVDAKPLKLPESQVKDSEIFKDTVFARKPFIS